MFDRVNGLLSFSVMLYTKLQNKRQYLEVALDVRESCTRGRHDGQDTTDSTPPPPFNNVWEGVSHVWYCRRGWAGHAPRGLSFVASHTVNNCWTCIKQLAAKCEHDLTTRKKRCDELLTYGVTQLGRNI